MIVGAMNQGGLMLPYFFPYAGILVTVAIGLLFGIFAALAPARRAARMSIIQALKFE